MKTVAKNDIVIFETLANVDHFAGITTVSRYKIALVARVTSDGIPSHYKYDDTTMWPLPKQDKWYVAKADTMNVEGVELHRMFFSTIGQAIDAVKTLKVK